MKTQEFKAIQILNAMSSADVDLRITATGQHLVIEPLSDVKAGALLKIESEVFSAWFSSLPTMTGREYFISEYGIDLFDRVKSRLTSDILDRNLKNRQDIMTFKSDLLNTILRG